MRVLLAGGTGLIGRLLLKTLPGMEGVAAVDTISRRPLADADPRITQHVAAMTDWPTMVGALSPDVAISTLGTTMRQAGSEAAFAAVDLDAVIAFARAAGAAGARRFLGVSSVGAHQASRNFYLSTKGKAEAGIQAVGFDRIDIFRPGLLRGDRGGAPRIGERIGILISPLTDILTPRVLDHYRSIAAADVARAMATMLSKQEPGLFVHENRAMWDAIQSR